MGHVYDEFRYCRTLNYAARGVQGSLQCIGRLHAAMGLVLGPRVDDYYDKSYVMYSS